MQTTKTRRWVALGTLGVLSFSTLGGMTGVAEAGSKGRRNTTIGLGAVTAYGLLKGKKTVAIAGGLGTLYAYKRYRDAKKREGRQTIGQVFGNTPIYDSRGKRYSRNARFESGRTYYNARGRAIG